MSLDLSRSRSRASVSNADEPSKSIFHDKDAEKRLVAGARQPLSSMSKRSSKNTNKKRKCAR